jgi:3-deoxy-D-arabino-heptulosonate 7-phosphate (DAHP) synthase class II
MNNLEKEPIPQSVHWYYGFKYITLEGFVDENNLPEKLRETLDYMSDVGTLFGHELQVKYEFSGSKEDLIVNFSSSFTALDKSVFEIFESAGYPFHVLMTVEEQNSFIEEKVLKKSVLNRIMSYNGNSENVIIQKKGIEKSIDILNYSKED